MDVTDKLLERLNSLLAMALPKDGKATAEADNAMRILLRDLKGVDGTAIKLVRHDHDDTANEPPPFAPPPPDGGDSAAQEAYLAGLLASYQRQRAQEDLQHLEKMHEREHITDLQIAAKWAEFNERMRAAREIINEAQNPTTKKMTPAEIAADMMKKRRRK